MADHDALEGLDEALVEHNISGAERLLKDTSMAFDASEVTNFEDTAGWSGGAPDEGIEDVLRAAKGLDDPEPPKSTLYEQAEAGLEAAKQYGPIDKDFVMSELEDGTFEDLTPDHRLPAVYALLAAEDFIADEQFDKALAVIRTNPEIVGELEDRYDLSDFEEFLHEEAGRRAEVAGAEINQLVEQNPILGEGPGAALLRSALGYVQLTGDPGQAREVGEAALLAAKEVDREEREQQFLESFYRATGQSDYNEYTGTPEPGFERPAARPADIEGAVLRGQEKIDYAQLLMEKTGQLGDGLSEIDRVFMKAYDREQRRKADDLRRGL